MDSLVLIYILSAFAIKIQGGFSFGKIISPLQHPHHTNKSITSSFLNGNSENSSSSASTPSDSVLFPRNGGEIEKSSSQIELLAAGLLASIFTLFFLIYALCLKVVWPLNRGKEMRHLDIPDVICEEGKCLCDDEGFS
uniref:Uncharacterized protein n=1 Tax=Lepeophtheirus salmonis TaxID=72036 RepID=A0A0K2T7B8_LEPSM